MFWRATCVFGLCLEEEFPRCMVTGNPEGLKPRFVKLALLPLSASLTFWHCASPFFRPHSFEVKVNEQTVFSRLKVLTCTTVTVYLPCTHGRQY